MKNTFLYDDITEQVYKEQPCLFRKAIYNLKQSPLVVLLLLVVFDAVVDHSVFYKQTDSGCMIFVYVDDILLTCSNITGIQKTKDYLQTLCHKGHGQT